MPHNWAPLLVPVFAYCLVTGLKADLDFLPPWQNDIPPKGCYKLDSVVKCYRPIYEKPTNTQTASEGCRRDNGRLAFPADEPTWKKIVADILLNNPKLKYNWLWLGGRIPASKTYIVNDDNQQVIWPDTNYWKNTKIGRATNEDRCILTLGSSGGNWEWQLSDVCYTRTDNAYYMCEYTVIPQQRINSTCNMDDLEINIANANFNPAITLEKTVQENTIVKIECWKGYQLSGNASTKCINSAWSHYPKCNPVCILPEKSPHLTLIACEKKTIYKPGEEVLFVCHDGYKSKSDYSKTHFSLKCNEEGTWTGYSEGDCIPTNEYEIVEIDISTRIHQSIRLYCGLEKTSTGLLTWHFNDKPLNSSGNYIILQSGTLIINNVTDLDQGMYFCIRHDSGIYEISSVYYELTRNAFNTEGENGTTMVKPEGRSVILKCHGRLFGKVKWTKSGQVIRHSRTHYILPTGALFIQHAHFSDTGVYQCITRQSLSEGIVAITHNLEVRDANDC